MTRIRYFLAKIKRSGQATVSKAKNLLMPDSGLQKIAFIAEKNNWSIRWDGHYITENINKIHPNISRILTNPAHLKNSVVHFGSQYMWPNWRPLASDRNRYAVTYFHGKPEDGSEAADNLKQIMLLMPKTDYVITASRIMEKRLLEWGVPENKLIRIPIGVDTNFFTPSCSEDSKKLLKLKFGIPIDRICIGSFQKDGIGWGDGIQPKLIKGPDILIKTIKHMSDQAPIFVLLTGPARGYVKNELDRMKIPYIHLFLKNYLEIVEYYRAVDLYLMTSREEGGPKSIMECMATGTAIVATRCGMAEDIIEHGKNGILVDFDSPLKISDQAIELLGNSNKLNSCINQARLDIQAYDWSIIAKLHLNKVYLPMLEQLN